MDMGYALDTSTVSFSPPKEALDAPGALPSTSSSAAAAPASAVLLPADASSSSAAAHGHWAPEAAVR